MQKGFGKIMGIFERTDALIGMENRKKLNAAHVAVFGIGGVGSYAVEALARAGVCELTLVDSDTVSESNINRQLIALESTVGMSKTAVAAARVRDINHEIKVNTKNVFFDSKTVGEFDFSAFDYVIDAIDSVTSKILLIETAKSANVPLISSMGTGNKLDPSARVMRYELKNRGITHQKVLYSTEQPLKHENEPRTPASISFVPSVAGLLLAGEVIRDIIERDI